MAKWMSFGSALDRHLPLPEWFAQVIYGLYSSLSRLAMRKIPLAQKMNHKKKARQLPLIVIFSETGYDGRGRCPENIDYIYIYIII